MNMIVEQASAQERGRSGENESVFVHIPSVFGKDRYKSVMLYNLSNRQVLQLFQRTISIL